MPIDDFVVDEAAARRRLGALVRVRILLLSLERAKRHILLATRTTAEAVGSAGGGSQRAGHCSLQRAHLFN